LLFAKFSQFSTAPNSWAAVCLWRRFFQTREEEELEALYEVLQAEARPCGGPSGHEQQRQLSPMQLAAAHEFPRFARRGNEWPSASTTSSHRETPPPSPPSRASLDEEMAWQMFVRRQEEERALNKPDLSVQGLFVAQ
jgi:hypothetical protein